MPPLRTIVLYCFGLGAIHFFPPGLPGQTIPNLPPLDPSDQSDPAHASGGPGGTAIILFYAVDTDNIKSTETRSFRIKILNDEGKKYADVEIPFLEKYSQVEEIQARTVAPDGKITPFDGQIYERDIAKSRKIRYHAKVFTLPDVRAGSIIEYAYLIRFKSKVPDAFQHPENYVLMDTATYPAANWNIQRDLFLKRGHFSLTPVKHGSVFNFSVGLGGTAGLQHLPDGRIQLDVQNVPAFEAEDFAPPEDSLKTRMNLYYAHRGFAPAAYWLGLSNVWSEEYDKYIGKSKAVAAEAARLCAPDDSRDAKLKKIYARVQLIRRLDSQEMETRPRDFKDNKNISDVLAHGYGYGHDVNLLFIGLARAAGLQAYPARLTSRRSALFLQDFPDYEQLDSLVVAVSVDDGFLFLDPESRYCPYGLLPWYEMNTGGLLVSYAFGRVLYTPFAKSNEAITRTSADLQMASNGMLSGKLAITYDGQDAFLQRQWAMDRDESERRDMLEESLKKALPQGATAKLLSATGWEKTSQPLITEFHIEIPDYATAVGRRMIVPLSLLHSRSNNPFASAGRVHSVNFDYPYETYEDVRITLPPDLRVDALPAAQRLDQGAAFYELSVKLDGDVLQVKRARRSAIFSVSLDQFPVLQKHYAGIVSADSLQATLKRADSGATN